MAARGWKAPLSLADRVGTETPLRQQRRGFAQGADDAKSSSKGEAQDSAGPAGSSSSASASATEDSSSSSADASATDNGKGEASEAGSTKAEGGAPPTAPVGEEAQAETEEKESPLELLQKELAEAQEKTKKEKHAFLMALADFENNKKRYQTERQARRRSATVNFATKMVEVYDNFDELAHAEDKVEHLSEACKGLNEGVIMTRNLYKTTLDRFDVEEVQVELGEPFNQARHESIGTVKGADVAANSVAELVQPGWVLEPKSTKPMVLRKAQVKVAA